MIILLVPMHSKKQINGDSNYVLYTTLIEAIGRQRPDWHFFVLFPDSTSEYKYTDDGFFRRRNVTRIPIHLSPRKQANAVTFDGRWWDILFRDRAFNLVWNFLPEISGQISRAGASSYLASGRPSVVASHNYTMHWTLPYQWESLEVIAAAQAMGSVLADWNVVNSEHTAMMLNDLQNEWLNASTIKAAQEKQSLIYYGPATEAMSYRANENAEPTIAYNHRLQNYKNWRVTFELLKELWDEGLRFRVKYLSNTAKNSSDVAVYPFTDITLNETRAEYLADLALCDLNVINSQYETFCISAIESMAYGQVLVAPNGTTFPEIVGQKETKYPYLFDSLAEQKAMLKDLLTSAALRHTWGKIVSDHTHKHFSDDRWAADHISLFERLEAERNTVLKEFDEGNGEACRETWRTLKPLDPLGPTLKELATAFYRIRREDGRKPFGSQSMPMPRTLRAVQALGGKATVLKGEIYFKFPEEVPA